jgi:hypothetical protein
METTFFVGRSTRIEVDPSGAAIRLTDDWGGPAQVIQFTSAAAADHFASEARTAVQVLEQHIADAYVARHLAPIGTARAVEDESVRDDYEWPEVVR